MTATVIDPSSFSSSDGEIRLDGVNFGDNTEVAIKLYKDDNAVISATVRSWSTGALNNQFLGLGRGAYTYTFEVDGVTFGPQEIELSSAEPEEFAAGSTYKFFFEPPVMGQFTYNNLADGSRKLGVGDPPTHDTWGTGLVQDQIDMAEGWISTVLNADDVAVLGSHGMFGPVNFEQDENITAPDVIMIRVNREGDIGFASNSLTELIKIEKV